MKLICYTILFICFSLISLAQAPENSPSINEAHAGMVYNNTTIRIKAKNKYISYDEARQRYDEIKGSPYLHLDHMPLVDLYMNTGEVVENATIQYDCYQNEIIATKGDQKEIILETAFFESIVSPTNDMPYPLLRVNRDNPTKFYEILYQDSLITFFKDTRVELTNHTRNIPGQQTTMDKFYRTHDYYIVRGRRSPVKFNLKKDDIFKLLPKQKRGDVKLAMDALKLNKLKKEADYVRVFNYFNEKG